MMAADSTGKASSGSPFRPPPATIWNNMVDAGRAFADGRLSSESPGATRSRATDLLKLKNSSEAVRRKGEILKIDGKVIETVTDESIWLNGIEPTTECRFGILKYPAGDGEVVTAQVSGVCTALVNVTDEAHTFAAAADEEYVLQSGGGGPLEILYAPEGTGELECVVRFVGGTGGAQIIDFEILYHCVDIFINSNCACATAIVTRTSCGGASVAVGDEILVWDRDLCWLNLPIDLLVGLRGWAVKMTNDDAYGDVACSESQEDTGPCRWVIKGLCCYEEVYGS